MHILRVTVSKGEVVKWEKKSEGGRGVDGHSISA